MTSELRAHAGNRARILTFALCAVFGLMIIIFIGLRLNLIGAHTALLTLSNHSNLAIQQVKVILYDEPCIVERLEVRKSVACRFPVAADSHYRVTWTESGSTRFDESFGYVTSGFDFHQRLIFLGEGKIAFEIDSHVTRE